MFSQFCMFKRLHVELARTVSRARQNMLRDLGSDSDVTTVEWAFGIAAWDWSSESSTRM